MTQRAVSSGGVPAPSQVIELLGGQFAQAGYEIEDVVVDTTANPPRITVVADGDTPLDLNTVAELSRAASELLDTWPDGSDAAENDTPYVLEVTSPGVDRPLTTEKHYRRAHGRRAELELTDGDAFAARIAGVADGVVRLVVPARSGWSVREVPLPDIAKAVVQVEFSSPSKKEMDLVGQTRKEADE